VPAPSKVPPVLPPETAYPNPAPAAAPVVVPTSVLVHPTSPAVPTPKQNTAEIIFFIMASFHFIIIHKNDSTKKITYVENKIMWG
jgi:hypothetical protein